MINHDRLTASYNHYDRLATEKGFCGSIGIKAEITLRINFMRDPRMKDYFVRPEGKSDMRLKIGNKYYDFEIKTGGGTLASAQSFGWAQFEDRKPEYCVRNKDYIFYIPRVTDAEDFEGLIDEGLAFTRDEFFAFLIENCGKRKHSFETCTKYNKDRSEINIQSVYLDQMAEAVESGNYCTIRTFMMDMGKL